MQQVSQREGAKGMLQLVNMSLLALIDTEVSSVVLQHLEILIPQDSHSQVRCEIRRRGMVLVTTLSI